MQDDDGQGYVIYPDSGTGFSNVFSSGWRNDLFRCGALGSAVAYTGYNVKLGVQVVHDVFDNWEIPIEVTPPVFGCTLPNAHQLVRDAQGQLVMITWVASSTTAPASSCRVEAFRLLP